MPILITSSDGILACLLTGLLFFISSETQDLLYSMCTAFVTLRSLPVPTPRTSLCNLLIAYCQLTACEF